MPHAAFVRLQPKFERIRRITGYLFQCRMQHLSGCNIFALRCGGKTWADAEQSLVQHGVHRFGKS